MARPFGENPLKTIGLTLPAPVGRITVQVSFRPGRRITVRIMPDGGVRVTAPLFTGTAVLERLLQEKSGWIARHLEALAEAPPIRTVYTSGSTHFLLGSPYTLSAAGSGRPGVSASDGQLLVSSRTPEDPSSIENTLRRWYRKQAETIIGERLQVWRPRLPALPEHSVRFRWMRSRWGSCSRRNGIVFNVQLVKAPLSCVDYVVAHELCHTLHHDHGPGFKLLLTSIMPEWKAEADRLKNLPVLL